MQGPDMIELWHGLGKEVTNNDNPESLFRVMRRLSMSPASGPRRQRTR